jgi:hypothetical protein
MLWQRAGEQLLLPINCGSQLCAHRTGASCTHGGLLGWAGLSYQTPSATRMIASSQATAASHVSDLVIKNMTCVTALFVIPALPQTLVSVSTIGTQPDMSEQQLIDAVKQELSAWFSPQQVSTWSHLRTYRIPFAQPNQNPPTNFNRAVSLGSGLYVCGDHRDSATFDAALRSGRRAAEALLQEQGGAVAGAASGSRTVVQASA